MYFGKKEGSRRDKGEEREACGGEGRGGQGVAGAGVGEPLASSALTHDPFFRCPWLLSLELSFFLLLNLI